MKSKLMQEVIDNSPGDEPFLRPDQEERLLAMDRERMAQLNRWIAFEMDGQNKKLRLCEKCNTMFSKSSKSRCKRCDSCTLKAEKESSERHVLWMRANRKLKRDGK